MRKFGIIALGAIVVMWIGACTSGNEDRSVGTEALRFEAAQDGGPRITFKDTVFDTSRIAQGEVVEMQFEFTNTGDEPLIIASVTGSCGCTIPRSYPRDKIFPGEGGKIDVIFDSDNKWGKQDIVIAIAANTVPSRTELLIKTDIAAPDHMKN